MKKLLFVTIFVLTGLYVFAQDAYIDQLTGTVEIKQPKDASFKTAIKGDKLFKDTIISTGFKSYAIVIIGGTTITVRPLTALSLAEIQKSEETEALNVSLQSGRVRVDVKPAAGTKALTTVSSPSSTASVRGTSFEFDTNNLYVNEGTVSFSGNNGQNVLVGAGGSSRVDQTGQVTTPRDERTANLTPPSPVGTSAKEMPASGPAAANTPFTFELEFQK
ncbi:FecR family protein [Treponema sp. R80B11-R83G3]